MKDPNFDSTWIVLLMVGEAWVCDFGYACGKGTWMHAKHFMNLGDARAAIQNPGWHNDPTGVRHAKPVKLYISVKAEPYTAAQIKGNSHEH